MIDYGKLAIGAFLLLVSFSSGWYLRNLDYKAFKLEVETVAKAQEEKVKSIRTQQELVTKSEEKEYEAKLNLLRQYYANGVRQPNTSKLPTFSNATTGLDAVTAYNLLAGQCSEATQQLVSLQEWTKEQMGIK